MAYMKTSMGPGDIAALPPTIGLSNKPTIGANDMPRTIRGMSPSPYAPPPLSGSGLGISEYTKATFGVAGVGFALWLLVVMYSGWRGDKEAAMRLAERKGECSRRGKVWVETGKYSGYCGNEFARLAPERSPYR